MKNKNDTRGVSADNGPAVQHDALVRFLGVVQAILSKVEDVSAELSGAVFAHRILIVVHGILIVVLLFLLDKLSQLVDQLTWIANR